MKKVRMNISFFSHFSVPEFLTSTAVYLLYQYVSVLVPLDTSTSSLNLKVNEQIGQSYNSIVPFTSVCEPYHRSPSTLSREDLTDFNRKNTYISNNLHTLLLTRPG